ncbi:hypothetical protein C7445_11124 [Alicyclobacillus sacchari]|uniref:Prepilin-type N-terminal cleavage/methylation domain-containing protein n=2 Tax=Alicyclobacillus sacchari TaxID=392010 RepID=A0A4R8LIV8_9BACL|nr:hypothetical protein C7445_11124 [Alicyclobacillus sacchari]GMA55880.1 hypothetical protein GCM10025858_03830 [Alicyclobacillus sacchari]
MIAFSLIEVMIGMSIGTLALTLATALFLQVREAAVRQEMLAEEMATLDSVHRVLTQDIHAATTCSMLGSSFVLNELNGTQYTYYVNNARELIRYRTGGGTAVLALHMQSFQVQPEGRDMLACQLTLTTGQSDWFVARLQGGGS